MAVSFLVRTDRYGVLEEIFFSEPIFLITEQHVSVFDILHPQALAFAQEHFRKALLTPDGICSTEGFKLKEMDAHIYCHMVSAQEHVMILASDTPLSSIEDNTAPSFHLIGRCMEKLLEKSLHTEDKGISSVANHFDQIQMLNNELVNTHRKLQQANAQLKRVNEDLNNRLVKDPLTNLVSRYQYRSEMQMLINRKPDALGVFCYIDIDNFKGINDTYGHATGDLYLVEFARRLTAIDTAYPSIRMRIAGDEFGLYIHGMQEVTQEFVTMVWERFSETVLSIPIEAETLSLPISCCLGMAIYGTDTKDIYLLIDYADFAMYTAKRSGKRTYRLFDRVTFQKEKDQR